MKGSSKIIGVLNKLLAEELTAISQYMVHAEICENYGYPKLHEAIEKQAIDEMKHAEKLISRIIFLEGNPTLSKLNKLNISKAVEKMLKNDLAAEIDAVKSYNNAIAAAEKEKDNGTKDLLISILKDEEAHVEFNETELTKIKQMTLEGYLSTLV